MVEVIELKNNIKTQGKSESPVFFGVLFFVLFRRFGCQCQVALEHIALNIAIF